MPTPITPDPDTRRRLLEAAGEVFTEHGYRAATVRDICQRANANVAAVNYHFGGKEELYAALLEHLGRTAVERHPPNLGVAADASAEERLFAFVHSFLLRMHAPDGLGKHGCLVAREMMDPTDALDRLVGEVIRPMFAGLRGIVAELIGGSATSDRVVLCARSVVGQCIFYRHAWPVIVRLSPDEDLTPARIREIAEHVTRFSLEGLKHMANDDASSRAKGSAGTARASKTPSLADRSPAAVVKRNRTPSKRWKNRRS